MNFETFLTEKIAGEGIRIFSRPRSKDGHKKFLGHTGSTLTNAVDAYIQYKTKLAYAPFASVDGETKRNLTPKDTARLEKVKNAAEKQFRRGGLVLIDGKLYSSNRNILRNPIEWHGGKDYFQDGNKLDVLT